MLRLNININTVLMIARFVAFTDSIEKIIGGRFDLCKKRVLDFVGRLTAS